MHLNRQVQIGQIAYRTYQKLKSTVIFVVYIEFRSRGRDIIYLINTKQILKEILFTR